MKKQAEKTAAGTCTDIKNCCREVWKFEASRGWVDSFISRHCAELTEKKSKIHHKRPAFVTSTNLPGRNDPHYA
jgi:hypothetical protein